MDFHDALAIQVIAVAEGGAAHIFNRLQARRVTDPLPHAWCRVCGGRDAFFFVHVQILCVRINTNTNTRTQTHAHTDTHANTHTHTHTHTHGNTHTLARTHRKEDDRFEPVSNLDQSGEYGPMFEYGHPCR